MISLYYKTEDRFSEYGIRHFIEKFGIPVQINQPSQSGIVIAYGSHVSGDFVIHIEENEIQNDICGEVTTPDDKIFICETPRDTGPGEEVIAHFEHDSARYPCVVRNKDGFHIGIDIFRETGWILAGHLDSIRPGLGGAVKKEIASQPCVDFFENILFKAILDGCCERHYPLVQKSYWPEGKTFAVCLTHDVDEIKKTYQWISRPLRYLFRRDLSGFKGQIRSFLQKIRGIEPYYTYDDIIRIEQQLGAKSTYFILKETGNASLFSKKTWFLYGRNRSLQSSDMQELIRKLLANGDEVAIHGSYFSFRDPVLLKSEVQELGEIIHNPVIGTRQHNLNLDIPDTWFYHVAAGLGYDTTLGFKDTIGFRWGTSFPFFPNIQEKPLPLLEIPLTIMDICLESSQSRESDCLRITDEVRRYNGVLNLLWHPPIFNTLEYPGARQIYLSITGYSRTMDAWITRARDIFEWLTLRNRQSFSYNFENPICTIIPSATGGQQFFTLYLPSDPEGEIRVKNAEVIRKKGRCLYIRTDAVHPANTIVVDLP